MDNLLETLIDVLDHVEYGVLVIDADFKAIFINQTYYQMWALPRLAPGKHYTFEQLVRHGQKTGAIQLVADALPDYAQPALGPASEPNHAAVRIKLADGRSLKYDCVKLAGGNRMLTYADVTLLVGTVARMEALASTDELTQIMNRRAFYKAGEVEVERSKRYGHALSVLMIDADYFKKCNDAYGHAVGDRVLCGIVENCRTIARSSDLLGRLGGEEFAMLLVETSLQTALSTAERLRRKIRETVLPTEQGDVSVTVSIGVASLNEASSNLSELLNGADDALYKAKRHGRDQVRC